MTKYISHESIEYQKKVAIEMWEFIKEWYVAHPGVYRHPTWLKHDFCYDYFEKTGQKIDWEAKCILCEKYHADYCHGCPLYSGHTNDRFCEIYFNLSDADFPLHMRPSICDEIIEAIESFKG